MSPDPDRQVDGFRASGGRWSREAFISDLLGLARPALRHLARKQHGPGDAGVAPLADERPATFAKPVA